jgi:NhaA family Na+:H+ antiporter
MSSIPPGPRPGLPLFGRGSWLEARRIGDVLRAETVGGLLLVGAAVVALIWANSPWREGYTRCPG